VRSGGKGRDLQNYLALFFYTSGILLITVTTVTATGRTPLATATIETRRSWLIPITALYYINGSEHEHTGEGTCPTHLRGHCNRRCWYWRSAAMLSICTMYYLG
jgi:hypothetical protein